jgi:hypothetical protein
MPPSSLDIFRSFILPKQAPNDLLVVDGVTSPECFQCWVANQAKRIGNLDVTNAGRKFQRALSGHLTALELVLYISRAVLLFPV